MNDRFAPEPVTIALLSLALRSAYLKPLYRCLKHQIDNLGTFPVIFACFFPPSQLAPVINKLVQALLD